MFVPLLDVVFYFDKTLYYLVYSWEIQSVFYMKSDLNINESLKAFVTYY